jgi:adenylate cyclase
LAIASDGVVIQWISEGLMSAYLTLSGEIGTERIACGAVTTVGRDKSNDIVLSDLQVSRNHAMVRRLGEADYYLIDSGSSNGCKLNERRITTPTLLCDGDRITIGGTQFTNSLSFQATVIVHSPLIKEITILVADMRGFTSLSEQLPIRTLTKVMNQWFDEVSDVIANSGGTVDKFIGDCVFARWESDDSRNNVINAMRTACVLSTTTSGLRNAFPELLEPLRIGVGINTGMASLGVGSDNTALGDAVNTAFRLETATKVLGADIVLSESSYAYLPDRYWRDYEQQVRLKGKNKPVNVIGLDFERAEILLGSNCSHI